MLQRKTEYAPRELPTSLSAETASEACRLARNPLTSKGIEALHVLNADGQPGEKICAVTHERVATRSDAKWAVGVVYNSERHFDYRDADPRLLNGPPLLSAYSFQVTRSTPAAALRLML
jgi:hypothetical protein